MVKKIISIILILLGLTALGLGIGSGTIWKPEESVTLKTGELDKATLVATNPGVVHQVNPHFTLTATAPDGGDVALVVGNTVDVAGWIGNDAHWLVTGATDWDKLNTQFVAEKVDPDAEPVDPAKEPAKDEAADPDKDEAEPVSPIANLAKSDMWYQVVEGEGTVTLTMDKVPDNVIFLAGSLAPDATSAPVISLTWDREVATPLMLPGILVGALLLAVGILVLIDSLRHTPDWTELEAQTILENAPGSKRTDSQRAADLALAANATDDAGSSIEVVSVWDGGSGSADAPDQPDPTAELNTDSGSADSTFAPKSEVILEDGDATETGSQDEDAPELVSDEFVSDEPISDDLISDERISDDLISADPSSDQTSVDQVDAEDADADDAGTEQTDTDQADDPDDVDLDELDGEPFVFTPVTLDFAGEHDTDRDAESESDLAVGAEEAPEVGPSAEVESETDPALTPIDQPLTEDGAAPQSWFGKIFGKKAKAPKPLLALTPLEPLATPDADSEFALPSQQFEAPSTKDAGTSAVPDKETQAALEVFAAMDEPDVTTGALQAAGLTRRQLREMRERKEQDAQRNVPTTTGSLDFGGPLTPAVPAPERPSWLPEGSDSTSASSWRAAWGVRPEGSAAATSSVPAPPAPEAVADQGGTDHDEPVQGGSGQVETDASSQKATPPTTRRALYSAYREAAERIANEDAERE